MAKKYLFVALFCGLAMTPEILGAQVIPVQDKSAWVDRTIVLLGRGADWFLTANQWLAETRKKTDVMIEKAELARRTARRYEDKALGELATLGGRVQTYSSREDLRVEGSDEFGMSALCSISSQAAEACTAGLKLKTRYEKAMSKLVNQAHYADSTLLSRTREGVEDGVYKLLGPSLQMRADSLRATPGLVGGIEATALAPLDLARAQGEQALTLEDISKKIAATVDVATAEAAKGPLSSGRARQLDALLTISDVKAEIELARGKTGELETYSLLMANQVRDSRRTIMAQLNGARRF